MKSVRSITGTLTAIMMLGVSGTAAAEIDCRVDTLNSLSKEARIERSYACANELNNSIYLANLAKDLYPRAEMKGWEPDWERAEKVYRDFIARAEKLPAKSFGAIYLTTAYENLARNYLGRHYPDGFWPRDLEKANYYADRLIDLRRRRGLSAVAMAEAYKQKSEIEAMIASSVGYIKGNLTHGANPENISSVSVGKYTVRVGSIEPDPWGSENAALYKLIVSGPKGPSENSLCIKLSRVTDPPPADALRGVYHISDLYSRSPEARLATYRSDNAFYIDWADASKWDELRVEIDDTTVETPCEWWVTPEWYDVIDPW